MGCWGHRDGLPPPLGFLVDPSLPNSWPEYGGLRRLDGGMAGKSFPELLLGKKSGGVRLRLPGIGRSTGIKPRFFPRASGTPYDPELAPLCPALLGLGCSPSALTAAG